ncbi:hypothetical protein [Microbacterium sediminis]|uniref:Uncharacterized protein n=1 Tax=Microbacterium sediminis TaxID=904291 RepID=A0A1B9NIK1_9MICO|nr:hypothetical protein [Microbacterium sediminis]OCG76428.1 hypothetical protein A7J15_11595 [Microbacterium sediminis]QBR73003.1 hypothetical protein E3O41_00110 [Microbacterium sediminis]
MYAALWRILPGPWPVKLLFLLALLAAALYGLFFHLFPWIAATFVPDDGTIDAAAALVSALAQPSPS